MCNGDNKLCLNDVSALVGEHCAYSYLNWNCGKCNEGGITGCGNVEPVFLTYLPGRRKLVVDWGVKIYFLEGMKF